MLRLTVKFSWVNNSSSDYGTVADGVGTGPWTRISGILSDTRVPIPPGVFYEATTKIDRRIKVDDGFIIGSMNLLVNLIPYLREPERGP